MKRSRLAALLGACLVSALLALAPATASAWWISQPRFEKQVVTEGDPDDPDLTYPGDDASPLNMPESTDFFETATLIVVTILDSAGF